MFISPFQTESHLFQDWINVNIAVHFQNVVNIAKVVSKHMAKIFPQTTLCFKEKTRNFQTVAMYVFYLFHWMKIQHSAIIYSSARQPNNFTLIWMCWIFLQKVFFKWRYLDTSLFKGKEWMEILTHLLLES